MKLHNVSAWLRIVANPDRAPLNSDLESQVQSLWDIETRRRAGALFNGRLFSIDEQAPDRITGTFVEYRLFVAQHRRPELFERLRVRPLAVSGIIESPDGLIFGRRNLDLMTDGGKWELVPSGGVDPESCLPGCNVDYMAQFYRELAEEVGIAKSDIFNTIPSSLVEDLATHVFDLVIAAQTHLSADQIILAFNQLKREYSELRIVRLSQFDRFYKEVDPYIVAVTTEIMRCHKFAPRLSRSIDD